MKADVFKKIIKEALREVLQEELGQAPKKAAPGIQKYEAYKPVVAKPFISSGDPIADLLQETKQQMSGEDYKSIYSGTSDIVSAPGLAMSSMVMEDSYRGSEPGLDISQFDFVNKAAAVFKASQEKDKQRFGG